MGELIMEGQFKSGIDFLQSCKIFFKAEDPEQFSLEREARYKVEAAVF